MSKKSKKSRASVGKFPVGVNRQTVMIVVIGAAIIAALMFLVTDRFAAKLAEADATNEDLQTEVDRLDARLQSIREGGVDSAAVLIDQAAAMDATIPIDTSPGAVTMIAASLEVLPPSISQAGLEMEPFGVIGAPVPGGNGLLYVEIPVTVTGSPAGMTAWLSSLNDLGDLLVTPAETTVTPSEDGRFLMTSKLRVWYMESLDGLSDRIAAAATGTPAAGDDAATDPADAEGTDAEGAGAESAGDEGAEAGTDDGSTGDTPDDTTPTPGE